MLVINLTGRQKCVRVGRMCRGPCLKDESSPTQSKNIIPTSPSARSNVVIVGFSEGTIEDSSSWPKIVHLSLIPSRGGPPVQAVVIFLLLPNPEGGAFPARNGPPGRPPPTRRGPASRASQRRQLNFSSLPQTMISKRGPLLRVVLKIRGAMPRCGSMVSFATTAIGGAVGMVCRSWTER